MTCAPLGVQPVSCQGAKRQVAPAAKEGAKGLVQLALGGLGHSCRERQGQASDEG